MANSTLDEMARWAEVVGLKHDRIESPAGLRAPFETDGHRWTCLLRADDEAGWAAVYASFPWLVSAPQRSDVALLLTRLNFGRMVGKFEMDLDDGEVHFMAGLDYTNCELEMEMVGNLLEHCVHAMRSHLSEIEAVARSDDS